MANKVITKTCESTKLSVYGINPHDYASGVKTIDYVYIGNFEKTSQKEIDSIKKALTSEDFIPAQIVSAGKATETKYALTLDEFIKLSHAAKEGEKITDCISRTIIINTLSVYGVNPSNLEKVESKTITYYGDYGKTSLKERERLMCGTSDFYFYPAYIKVTAIVEEKRVLTNTEFIKNAHVAKEDEIEG